MWDAGSRDRSNRRGRRPPHALRRGVLGRRSGQVLRPGPRRREAAGGLAVLEHGPPPWSGIVPPGTRGRGRRPAALRIALVGLGDPTMRRQGRLQPDQLPQRHRVAADSSLAAWARAGAGYVEAARGGARADRGGRYSVMALPEVFAGIPRRSRPSPSPIPAAARAWQQERRSYLVRVLLGLEADRAPSGSCRPSRTSSRTARRPPPRRCPRVSGRSWIASVERGQCRIEEGTDEVDSSARVVPGPAGGVGGIERVVALLADGLVDRRGTR